MVLHGRNILKMTLCVKGALSALLGSNPLPGYPFAIAVIKPKNTMKNSFLTLLLSLLTLSLSAQEVSDFPDDPKEICPIKLGSRISESATVQTLSGKEIALAEKIAEKPTLLIAYRGGWCPFCNQHLAEIQKMLPEIKKMGYQVIAISADAPENLKPTISKHDLGYTIYSGSNLSAFDALGIGFELVGPTLSKYQKNDIDLVASQNVLPVPTVMVFDKKGELRFSHVDPNYKERISGDLLMAVLENQ